MPGGEAQVLPRTGQISRDLHNLRHIEAAMITKAKLTPVTPQGARACEGAPATSLLGELIGRHPHQQNRQPLIAHVLCPWSGLCPVRPTCVNPVCGTHHPSH